MEHNSHKIHYTGTRTPVFLNSYVAFMDKYRAVELEKQFTGTWKAEGGKDTLLIKEVKPYFNGGFVTYLKIETKGKIIMQEMTHLGYDKNTCKLIESALTNLSPDITLMTAWFTSANKAEEVPLEFISDPESAPLKWTFE
jgi:hypothetical protein